MSDSSVHGINQARILQWTFISLSRGSFPPRDQTCVSCITGGVFTIWATRGPSVAALYVCNSIFCLSLYWANCSDTASVSDDMAQEARGLNIDKQSCHCPSVSLVRLLTSHLLAGSSGWNSWCSSPGYRTYWMKENKQTSAQGKLQEISRPFWKIVTVLVAQSWPTLLQPHGP